VNRIVLSMATAVVMIGVLAWPQRVLTHGSLTTTVLFDREIVHVLNDHCVMCHNDRGLAFPLETYEQTWLRGQTIRTSVLLRHMPPWPAVSGYGTFANDNGLTLRESQFVISWVEGLGPRNSGKVFLNVANPNAPPPQEIRAFAHTGHWRLGEPDLKRQLPPATIAALQPDSMVTSAVDLGLASERTVRALEYMPGDPRVVRAVVLRTEQTGQWLGTWTPWYGFVKAPDGTAFRMAAGTRIAADTYYRGAAEPVNNRGTIGLFFADARPVHTISDLVLDGAAGAPGRSITAQARLTADTDVWALQPRIGAGLSSIQVSAHGADGSTEVLLYAKDISPEWPTSYVLDKPRRLPRGFTLSVSARFDRDAPAGPLLTISRYEDSSHQRRATPTRSGPLLGRRAAAWRPGALRKLRIPRRRRSQHVRGCEPPVSKSRRFPEGTHPALRRCRIGLWRPGGGIDRCLRSKNVWPSWKVEAGSMAPRLVSCEATCAISAAR
jgi:hypothetical protein